jgi:hypothetical protein
VNEINRCDSAIIILILLIHDLCACWLFWGTIASQCTMQISCVWLPIESLSLAGTVHSTWLSVFVEPVSLPTRDALEVGATGVATVYVRGASPFPTARSYEHSQASNVVSAVNGGSSMDNGASWLWLLPVHWYRLIPLHQQWCLGAGD